MRTVVVNEGRPRGESRGVLSGFLALLAVLLALEVLAAALAFETLGDLARVPYVLALGLNVIPLGLFACRCRRAAVVAVLLIGALTVPHQLRLAVRLHRLEGEAARIVAHLYEVRLASGAFPKGLEGYRFERPDLRDHFTYVGPDRVDYAVTERGGFLLFWWVGTRSTSHHYAPKGGFGYYPD